MKMLTRILVSFLFCAHVLLSFADGSKDLYPAGIKGGRAFLETYVTNNFGTPYQPFYNFGRHYAYARKGETLAVASSAHGVGAGGIRVFSPSGVLYIPDSFEYGRIEGRYGMSNRQAELAGPRLGYDAFEIAVEEEGIWVVEFISPTGNSLIPDILADDEWIQLGNQNFIAAWDVSVRNSENTAWLTGRVFVNVLNLYMNGSNMANSDRAFYSSNYVLTKDGYYYRVGGNGSIGLRFTYFVNNSGFLNSDGTPSYKSSTAGYNVYIHDPNSNDAGNQYVTHKIFYTLPNEDLPSKSKSKEGETWLLNEVQIPTVFNIQIGASELTLEHINTKGSVITFDTNYAGRYKVRVKSKNPFLQFPPYEAIIDAKNGANSFIWPGKDGENNLLPVGKYEIEVSIASIEGEVHFPYFDMEINPNGLMLERYNRQTDTYEPAILYWDDSQIPLGQFPAEYSNPITNLSGIPSNINGHRWGSYSFTSPVGINVNNNLFTGANSFGNNMAMDTWSYAVQIEEVGSREIVVEIADLEVLDIQADKDTIELDEIVEYRVLVRNNGPSDANQAKFEYTLSKGFKIHSVQLQPSNCATINSTSLVNNTATLLLDIKNGCQAVFIIKSSASQVPDSTYGTVYGTAGMVRPRGITDPDATSNNIAANEPGTAQQECMPTGCNNIKVNAEVFLLEPFNERGQIALVKTVVHLDENNSGFHDIGETLVYTFTLHNIGQVDVKNLIITDSLLSPATINLEGVVLRKGEQYSITSTYTISSADMDRKYVLNQAFVLGKNPRNFDVKDLSGTSINNNEKTKTDIDKAPQFSLKKSVSNRGTGENKQFTLGDTIVYRFEVLHKGDIAVKQISLYDPLLFEEVQEIFNGELQHRTFTISYPYIITEGDIQKGIIENSALLQGIDVKYAHVLKDMSGVTFEDDAITITPVATAPIAIEDYIEIYQGQRLKLDLLQNDQQGSSNWTNGKIEIIKPPTLGRLEVAGINVFYSQINAFDSGSDYFTYRIIDNSRLQSNIVRVHVEIIKTIPVAVDDYYVQEYNKKINISPTDNDYVEYSTVDIESISIVNLPRNGTLIYLGNGRFSYESDKTYSGMDEFTYRIKDKNGNWSEPATVLIEVAGLFIPNVITPNGDGLNDVFKIVGAYKYETIEIQVFDRFRNLVYQNSNYQNNWIVSSSVRDGTYFYIVKLLRKDKKPLIMKGSFLITRTLL